MIKSHKVPIGLSPKLVEKYQGQFYISEIGPNFTYKIRDCKERKEVKSFLNALQIKDYNDSEIDRQHLTENSCTYVQNEGQTKNDAQNLDEEIQIDDTQDEIDQFPFDIRKLLKYRHKDQHFRIEWTD